MASYAFQKYLTDNEIKVGDLPKWRFIVKEAIDSTRQTYKVENYNFNFTIFLSSNLFLYKQNTQIIVLIDKKSFIAEHRDALAKAVEEEGASWTFKSADIKKLYDKFKST